MDVLKLKSKGAAVQELQVRLNLVLSAALVPDGDFGNLTHAAVCKFQRSRGLEETGRVDTFTWAALEADYAAAPKFVIVLDAGHGGLHPATGEYTTPAKNGKRYRHKGAVLHNGGDVFYEGVENRIIADMLADELRKLGIFTINAHHPYLDYWGTNDDVAELKRRGTWAMPYLQRGFSGYYHSIHSNAAGDPEEQTQAEIDDIRGGIIFTTRGITPSDTMSQKYLDIWTARFGAKWVRLADEKESAKQGGKIGLGSDYEKNFAVIKHNEDLAAELKIKGTWEAFLEEFDFFTSRKAAEWIMQPETRKARVAAMVELAQWRYSNFLKQYKNT